MLFTHHLHQIIHRHKEDMPFNGKYINSLHLKILFILKCVCDKKFFIFPFVYV